jgi:hypothetical protein
MLVLRPAFALLALTLGACGARTGLGQAEARDAGAAIDAPDARVMDAPRDVPADVASDTPDVPADTPPDVPVLDAGDPCEIGEEPLRGELCMQPLFGREPTLSCPGGFVDVAARGEGTLVWECGGFRAEARFGERTYRGTRIGDDVALCIRTEFDYADGCRWESSQRLEGELSGEALTLTYRERSIAGMDCFPPCTADALVELR